MEICHPPSEQESAALSNKLKTKSLALLLLSALVLPLYSYALGIGPIHVKSNLNQPLNADIPLNSLGDLDESQIKITLADPNLFTKAGVYRAPWLSDLQFSVIKKSEETGLIQIHSKNPIKDPVVDLLLNVAWPTGKIVRQYTVLLDPQDAAAQPYYVDKDSYASSSYAPKTADVATAQNNMGARTIAATLSFGKEYGPVKEEDTLWQIANKLVSGSPYTVSQGVLAIYQKNPHAFTDNNMNKIIVGEYINLPTQNEVKLASAAEAKARIAKETSFDQSVAETIPSAIPSERSGMEMAQSDFKNRKPLKILSSTEDVDLGKKKSSESNGLEDSLTDSATSPLQERIAMMEEALDTLQRKNEDIIQRNEELKKNNESLVNELSSKTSELEALKSQVNLKNESLKAPTLHTETKNANVPSKKVAGQSLSLSQNVALSENAIVVAPASASWLTWALLLLATGAITSVAFYGWRRKYALTKEKTIDFAPLSQESVTPTKKNEESIVNYGLDFDLDKALTDVKIEDKREGDLRAENALNAKFEYEAIKRKYSDKLEEAEIAIAYEHYHQAEQQLLEILNTAPNHWLALLKLLELFIYTENFAQFNVWKQKVPADLHEIDIDIWSKIEFLVEKVKQESVVEASQKDSEFYNESIEENTSDRHVQPALDINVDFDQTSQIAIPEYEIKEFEAELVSASVLESELKPESDLQPVQEVFPEGEEAHLYSSATEEKAQALDIALSQEQEQNNSQSGELLETEVNKLELLPDEEPIMPQDTPFSSVSSLENQTLVEKTNFIHLNHLGEDTESLIELAKAFIEARETASAIGLLQSLKEKSSAEQTVVIEHLLNSLR